MHSPQIAQFEPNQRNDEVIHPYQKGVFFFFLVFPKMELDCVLNDIQLKGHSGRILFN